MATTATTQTNSQFSINYRDLLRGLLIAVVTSTLTALLGVLQTSGLDHLNWKEIGVIGLTSGVAYLVKNFFSPTEIVVQNPTANAVTAVKEGAPVQVNGQVIAAKSTDDPKVVS